MTELILLLQADRDIQTAYERYENYQEGRDGATASANVQMLSIKPASIAGMHRGLLEAAPVCDLFRAHRCAGLLPKEKKKNRPPVC